MIDRGSRCFHARDGEACVAQDGRQFWSPHLKFLERRECMVLGGRSRMCDRSEDVGAQGITDSPLEKLLVGRQTGSGRPLGLAERTIETQRTTDRRFSVKARGILRL